MPSKQYLWQQEMRAKGLCVTCAQPAMPGRIHCQPCYEKVSRRAHDRYWRLKEQGICTLCAKRKLFSKAYCEPCLERMRVYQVAYQKRKAMRNG